MVPKGTPENEPENEEFSDEFTEADTEENNEESPENELVEFSGVAHLTSKFLGPSKFSDAELRQIDDFDSFCERYADTLIYFDEFTSSGAAYLNKTEKDVLIGMPFLMLQWYFVDSTEFDSGYVSCEILTKENKRYRFIDGTKTGLLDEMREITEDKGGVRNGGIARWGLRRRSYPWPKDPKPGQTQRTVYVYNFARFEGDRGK